MSIQDSRFPDIFIVNLLLQFGPHQSPGPKFCLATSQPIKMQLNLPSQLILNWDWLRAVCVSQVFIG